MPEHWKVDDDIPNKDVINDFLLSLKLANKSMFTIRTYRNILVNFFKKVPIYIQSLTEIDILNWLQEHINVWKEVTINNHLKILSIFFSYCQVEGYIDKNLIKSRWKPKIPKSVPRYLERNEVAKLKIQSEKESLRDQIILEFLLSSGCRVREAHRLNIQDIDLPIRTIKVVGKGQKIRFVHISEYCAILFQKYLDTHPKSTQAFFVNSSGNRLSVTSIQKIISDLGKKARLDKKVTPHCMRHTFATSLLAKGADIEFIQDELGHSFADTTRIYARLPKEELINQYKKFMG